MRLIKVTANQPSFKTVVFNPTGISLIVGTRTAEQDHQDDRSYNGVGKSLLVEIVHFCLGSNPNTAFQNSLPDWEFSLYFEIDDRQYLSTRSTNHQKKIIFNGQEIPLKQFNEEMEKLTFSIPELGASDLSFRSLIPRFIRRSNQDYIDPRHTSGDREDYTVILRNLFLLGMEINLIQKKYQLRKRQVETQAFEKNFKKDPFIKEYYTGNKDATLQVKFLELQIGKLDKDLAAFKVAEDFYEIENLANKINSELKDLKNKKTVIENAIHNVEKSLQVRTDYSKEKIISLYNEILDTFKESSIQRLEAVEDFHKKLLKNRISRLGQERIKLKNELKQALEKIDELNSDLDKKLSYLSDKRALDQYVSVSNQRSEHLRQLHKLQDYQTLLQKSRDDLIHISRDLAEETIKTNDYLQNTESERNNLTSLFSELAKLFYPEAPAGITIDNNTGENKVRFNFDVRIEADGSDGINSVKIFCYDLAVLLLECNHRINFIWHDSRLFSDIDPRQRATLFKTAHKLALENQKQYIATVNQDQLEALKGEFTEEEYSQIFMGKRVILELKDDGYQSKLLGIQVDMHY